MLTIPEIEIESMTGETVEEVERLEQQCFSTPWSLASLTEELTNPLAVFLTARAGSEIAGYVGMHHVVDEGYITNIAVSPDYRRRGIAMALMKSLLEYGRMHKLSIITLEVRESNLAAKRLYQSLGFKEAGRRKSFYTQPVEDGIIMTRQLEAGHNTLA